MTINELVDRVRSIAGSHNISGYDGFLAVQINIIGENHGVFYVEIKDGVLSIEPYEYKDRDAAITVTMANFIKLLDKKMDPVLAFTMGKLKIEGNVAKVLDLVKLL